MMDKSQTLENNKTLKITNSKKENKNYKKPIIPKKNINNNDSIGDIFE